MMLKSLPVTVAISYVLATMAYSTLASYNTTNQTSPWQSGRSKRSIFHNMPSELTMRVKYPSGEEVDLQFTKESRHLANKHLPVMTTANYLMPDVMSNVGEFVMYHDLEKCSAIVYFDKLKKFFGVVGTNHYIRGLPFEFDSDGQYLSGTVSESYVENNEHQFVHIDPEKIFPPPSDSEAWEKFLRLTTDDLDRESGRTKKKAFPDLTKTNHLNFEDGMDEDDVDFVASQSRKARNTPTDPKTLNYYLETLVVITRDIAEPFKISFGEAHYIEWIVRNYIVYYNAVDMMFRKLRMGQVEFYINIARIIIEDASMPFGFEVYNSEVQFTDITTKLTQYIRSKMFPPDSFDHISVHTHCKIMDDTIHVSGLTKKSGDLYEARKINNFYEAVSISVIGYRYFYADYTVAVHEFGRVLKFELDSQRQQLEDGGQCYAIMQREGPKCENCLKWSVGSHEHYQKFFRKNRNRCFMMNKPRSLRPPIAYRDLTPHRQCLCFGYDSYLKNQHGRLVHIVGLKGCTEPLQCLKIVGDETHQESTLLPFDGTRCTHAKACWHGECLMYLPLQVETEMQEP